MPTINISVYLTNMEFSRYLEMEDKIKKKYRKSIKKVVRNALCDSKCKTGEV